MIAKHVPMRSLKKSDLAELVEYITDKQDKAHRLGEVRVTNCEADLIDAATSEMHATQQQNKRAKGDKTYHLIVSFPAGENPPSDTLKAIEERICTALGYAEHQRISAVHHDTDNLHLHIAINKVHPTRFTLHDPYPSYRILAETSQALEAEFGLQRVNHQTKRSLAEGRAGDMERHAGIESLVGWVKRECAAELLAAPSWDELHAALKRNGLELQPRGAGLVIVAENGTTAKASTIDRELSKAKLEARLGPMPGAESAQAKVKQRQYDKQPMRSRIDTAPLYADYQASARQAVADRRAALAEAQRERQRQVEAAKRNNKLRRAAIKLVGGKRTVKKVLYNQAAAALRAELKRIATEHNRKRVRLTTDEGRKTWADWLKAQAEQGNETALRALRARDAAQGLKGDTLKASGHATTTATPPTIDNITKAGTIIYRAGRAAIRDDGDKLQVSRENSRESLEAALRLAVERYGERITVNGSQQFKDQIVRTAAAARIPLTFADAALERQRQALLTTKDHANESDTRGREPNQQRPGDARPNTPGVRADRRGDGGRVLATAGRNAVSAKPNIGRLGRVPPPHSKNRLRSLSQLGLVRIASGGEVLLPRHVPSDVEQQGAPAVHPLRRDVSGPGLRPPQQIAVEKYIAEREQKRAQGFDIPQHRRYTEQEGSLTFAGLRNVEGQALALLNRGDSVLVLPVDEATARRLKRTGIGEAVAVTPKGSVRVTKGRTR